MPKTHYPRECPLCGKSIIQMSKHFNKAHKTSITDWQLDREAHGLDATILRVLPDTGESGETYDAEMASIHNSKPRTEK